SWKHSDFLCKNNILNELHDDLYNVYNNITFKDFWDALEKMYKMEDVELKKFIVAKFQDFKMVDKKYVVTQVQKLQVIINDLLEEGLLINKAFQIAAMIEKAPKKAKKKDQENVVEFEDNSLCAMLYKFNLVDNTIEWWIDSDATRHVCAKKENFASYEPTQGDDRIYMANLITTKVEGTGKVLLKMTSRKV
ncbi:hypothetical protein EJD97_004443, partial [Solanum chilense]